MAEMNGRSAPAGPASPGRRHDGGVGASVPHRAQEDARARAEMSLHQAIARRELANQLAAAQRPELSAPVLGEAPGGAPLAISGKGVFIITGLTIGFSLLLGAAVMASSSSNADPQKRE